jgi:hypothetical protein
VLGATEAEGLIEAQSVIVGVGADDEPIDGMVRCCVPGGVDNEA